jgi:hypothetical protein
MTAVTARDALFVWRSAPIPANTGATPDGQTGPRERPRIHDPRLGNHDINDTAGVSTTGNHEPAQQSPLWKHKRTASSGHLFESLLTRTCQGGSCLTPPPFSLRQNTPTILRHGPCTPEGVTLNHVPTPRIGSSILPSEFSVQGEVERVHGVDGPFRVAPPQVAGIL